MNKTVQIRVDEGQLINHRSNYLQVECEKNVLIIAFSEYKAV